MQLQVSDFSSSEREFLLDIVNWWLDGMEDATEDVITDRTLENVEEFSVAVQGMREQHHLALSIKAKLDLGGLQVA